MEQKKYIGILVLLLAVSSAGAQTRNKLSEKVSIATNANIETYFIAEKLAVDHIGNYVFSKKELNFSHQPIVYFAYQKFAPWRDSATVLRIATILKTLRDILHDNAPILEYLLYRNELPLDGFRWPVPQDLPLFDEKKYPGAKKLGLELTDSLSSFYKKANVGAFLKANTRFYKGAVAEASGHINAKAIPFMEKWYGKSFVGYEFYLMPGMPITPGDDNYRAFGPMLSSPQGHVSAMVFSSSVQLPLQHALKAYQHFGFDNAEVIRFLTVHEVGHSFVNPALVQYQLVMDQESQLFTPLLAKSLEASYISTWETCVIEHLVRLGEIRIAKAIGDQQEEARLRKMHIKEFGFILLPILEQKITEYEQNRQAYPEFQQFIPEIFKTLHQLTPAAIDKLVKENQQ